MKKETKERIIEELTEGCGKVVWGNKEFGELNCGDECGAWENKKWVIVGKYWCKDCQNG